MKYFACFGVFDEALTDIDMQEHTFSLTENPVCLYIEAYCMSHR